MAKLTRNQEISKRFIFVLTRNLNRSKNRVIELPFYGPLDELVR